MCLLLFIFIQVNTGKWHICTPWCVWLEIFYCTITVIKKCQTSDFIIGNATQTIVLAINKSSNNEKCTLKDRSQVKSAQNTNQTIIILTASNQKEHANNDDNVNEDDENGETAEKLIEFFQKQRQKERNKEKKEFLCRFVCGWMNVTFFCCSVGDFYFLFLTVKRKH